MEVGPESERGFPRITMTCEGLKETCHASPGSSVLDLGCLSGI